MKKLLSFAQQEARMKNLKLLDFMAKACLYAQEHICDPQAWPQDKGNRSNLLQCTSYQIACFLAQNTVEGEAGVESNIILDDLASTKKNADGFMIHSLAEWKKILNKLVKEMGGWK